MQRFQSHLECRAVLFYLFLLFIVTPFVELTILLWLADVTHWTYALALIVVTGAVGTILVRWQGFQVYRRIREEMAAGRVPGEALADGAMVLFAGALLLTPGLLTDLFGFTLLIPFCRAFYRRMLMRRFQVQTFSSAAGQADDFFDDKPPQDRIIDVKVMNPDEAKSGASKDDAKTLDGSN